MSMPPGSPRKALLDEVELDRRRTSGLDRPDRRGAVYR